MDKYIIYNRYTRDKLTTVEASSAEEACRVLGVNWRDCNVFHEKIAAVKEGFSMDVTLTIDWTKIDARIRMETTVLHNVTEIHMGYRPGRIAFESDIHGTGCTYDTSQIVEMEVRPATHKAKAF